MSLVGEMLIHDRDIEIAKNALKEGLDIMTIQRITGLDRTTLKKLQAELQAENK